MMEQMIREAFKEEGKVVTKIETVTNGWYVTTDDGETVHIEWVPEGAKVITPFGDFDKHLNLKENCVGGEKKKPFGGAPRLDGR